MSALKNIECHFLLFERPFVVCKEVHDQQVMFRQGVLLAHCGILRVPDIDEAQKH